MNGSGIAVDRPSSWLPAAATPQEEFDGLMRKVRGGSPDAAKLLVQRYGPHVLRIVRRWLHDRMRSQFDSEDFTQAVWASFFAFQEEPADLQTPEELLKYLVRMAKNKVIDAIRHRSKGRRPIAQVDHSFESSIMCRLGEPAAKGPSPSNVAVVKEELGRFMEKQPAHHLRIWDLSNQGKSCEEIAAAYGIDARSVRRILQKFPQGFAR